ncbi:hypothetical protein SFRURICE_008403 [Spodoptera frugiperda]|nr:hypothetical protein SFRURICE_008403 [Spodoptera frugiperda]
MLERYSRISLAGNSEITPPPVPVNDTGDVDSRTFQGGKTCNDFFTNLGRGEREYLTLTD